MARVTSRGVAVPDLIGGHVALDLINTVSWRLDPDRYRDNLTDLTTLVGWCQRAGALDQAASAGLTEAAWHGGPPEVHVLQRVLALREELTEVLAPLADTCRVGSERDVDESMGAVVVVPPSLHARLTEALTHSHLSGVPARWKLTVERIDDVPHLLALHALDLLQSPHLPLLRVCQGTGCGWLFLDRSRNHTRRWCSTGDCGNRDRARRHYARTTRTDSHPA